MAIIGYWDDLAEAQKLVQHDLLLAGVVEEIYKEGELMPKLPVFQIDSKNIAYYRESTLPSGAYYDIGEQLVWQSGVTYSAKITVELKRAADQRILDNFMMLTYKTPNDYRSQVLKELTKGITQWLEDQIIYGYTTDVAKSITGICELCDTTDMEINEAGALSLDNLRDLIDRVRPRPNILVVNRTFARKFDRLLQEKGLTTWASFNYSADELGKRLMTFDGIPILRTDFLSADEDDDALGYGSSAGKTSIYAIRFGQIMEGGLCLAMGGPGGELGRVMQVKRLDNLEDYDAEGIRVVGYFNLALGSTKALGRIRNITASGDITA